MSQAPKRPPGSECLNTQTPKVCKIIALKHNNSHKDHCKKGSTQRVRPAGHAASGFGGGAYLEGHRGSVSRISMWIAVVTIGLMGGYKSYVL